MCLPKQVGTRKATNAVSIQNSSPNSLTGTVGTQSDRNREFRVLAEDNLLTPSQPDVENVPSAVTLAGRFCSQPWRHSCYMSLVSPIYSTRCGSVQMHEGFVCVHRTSSGSGMRFPSEKKSRQ